ncbi:hypothetical protein DYB30_008599, partial [Aphanomyces astaci]
MVAAITQAVEQHTFDQFTGRCRLPVAFMQDHGLFNGSAVAVYVNGDCYLCKAHASRQRNAFAIDTSIAIEATHVVLAALPKIRLEHTHEDDVFVSVLPSPLKSAASISLEPVPSDKSSNDDTNTVLQDPISLRILQDACRRLILHESCVIQLPHPTNNTSMTFRVHRTLPIGVVRVIRATRVVLFRTSEAEPRDDNNVILPLDVQLRKPAFDKSHQDEDAATTHVGGLHVELKKLEELIYMAVEFPSLQQDIGIQLPKGVLLSGPPGVGKTLLVRTAIRRCHASEGVTVDNLPSLGFAWVALPGSSRHDPPTPILARGWGRHIQFLEVLFCPRHVHAKDGWPTFAETSPVDTTADVVATQWLGDHVIMYLNFHDELCVFRACNDMLYLLGLKELHTARVQPWTQRIDTLIEDGEWLEGLGLALDHYEGLLKAAQTRAERDRFPPVFFTDRNKDQCVVDIFKMCVGESTYPADVSKRLEAAFQTARSGAPPKNFVPIGVADRMADLLMDYVRLAMGHAPSASLNLSHFQMLAGVAIEYCASTNRTDLLFAEIFKRFQEADKADIFVSLLAPYILHDQLHVLSADVLD